MVNDSLDVIVTSTCRKTIIPTINSFIENTKYFGKFRFIVNIDVKNTSYLREVINFLNLAKIEDFHINKKPRSGLLGLTDTINNIVPRIQTEIYFHLEDDWLFKDMVNLDALVCLMGKNKNINQIRLSKEKILDKAWLYHISDYRNKKYKKNENVYIDNIQLVKTHTWSFNPSLCRTKTAQAILPIPLDHLAETYFCKMMDLKYGSKGLFILGKIGDSAMVKDIGRNRIREQLRRIKQKLIWDKRYGLQLCKS